MPSYCPDGLAETLGEADALTEADAFGDADGLTDPFGVALGLAELLADGEGSSDGLGSIEGTIVAKGDGLTPIVDSYLLRSQTRYTASKMIISKITTIVIFLLIDNHLQAEQMG